MKRQRLLQALAIALALPLLFVAGCQPKKAQNPSLEPVKASPVEQISLYLSITPCGLMATKLPGSRGTEQISGGWGYTREDACIILNPQDLGQQKLNQVFLHWMQSLMDERNILEFTQPLPSGERLYVLDSGNFVQSPEKYGAKQYIRVLYSVFTVTEAQFRDLSHWAKSPKVTDKMLSDRVRSEATEQAREFWFDVTEPLAHNAKVQGL